MNKVKKQEILKNLDSEINGIKKSATEAAKAAKLFRTAGRSQQGDKRFFEKQSEMVKEHLERVISLRDEIEKSSDKACQTVEKPCFVKIKYQDGRELEFILASSVVGLPEVAFISDSSPLGKAILGKSKGDKFSHQLEDGREFEGKVVKVE